MNERSTSQPAEAVDSELCLPLVLEVKLQKWAAEGYPHEACGLLIGRWSGRRSETVRVTLARNLNRERPEDRYLLDPGDFLAADREARGEGLEIIGIWHSHPDHPGRPSQTDLDAAWPGYSYLIIATGESGATDLRSWRLQGGRFLEQSVGRKEEAS